MLPKAVLFDFDGVLVDSMPAHVEAWSMAAEQLFGSPLTSDQRANIVGRSTRVIASLIAKWGGDQNASGKLTEAKKLALFENLDSVRVFPTSHKMLASLSERGVPFGIASNAPRDYVRAVVDSMHLPVEVTLGCEDVVNPKPAPDLYLLCAKRLGISPADHKHVVVFEDSTHGIEAAVKAGNLAIGVASHKTPQQLRKAGAVDVVEDFEQFIGESFDISKYRD